MTTVHLSLGGLTAENVYQEAINKGLSQVDAAILVSGWIFENFGKSKRVFSYNQALSADEPGCQAQFNRSFHHVDWIDGESVVQAETTAGEDGFNLRFHRIEVDFDTVKQDLTKAFECLAELRKAVHVRFEEVKAELNRLNSDVHTCCNKGTGPVLTGPLPSFDGLVNTGMYLGNIKFQDKYVALWQTQQGYMMLPTVYSVGTDFVKDPRVHRAGNIARFAAENRELIQLFAEGGVRKDALLERFGNHILANGESLRANLEILPPGATFRSVDELISEVAEREASVLRSQAGTESAIRTAFGLDVELESVKAAPVETFNLLPHNARLALSRAGVDTVGKLAEAKPEVITRAFKAAGVESLRGEIAEWQATAKTLAQVR
ncbi:MAG: hypothetical protein JJT90_12270 [Ectothiorhodospiraceae bacterium]|nr:hypothetical protein [Ectothiorhodospiraceae bacterium]